MAQKIQIAYRAFDGKLFLTHEEATQYEEDLTINAKILTLKESIENLAKRHGHQSLDAEKIISQLFHQDWLKKELKSLGFVLKEENVEKGPQLNIQKTNQRGDISF